MLSRYTNLKKIGAGGMGVVYRGDDVTLRRPVALKFLTESSYGEQQQRARFLREARTAAALNHPSICTVYEVGEVREGEEDSLGGAQLLDPGTPFLAMEFVEGQTLESRLAEGGRLEQDALLDIAVGVAEGLAVAHGKGIVHRDLKPGNVMLTEDGRAKILDFGLAKPLGGALQGDPGLTVAETVSAELTRAGCVLGTVAYMSPEQALGKPVDSRSDVFSFGILLYEMAAGERPFRGESATSTLAKLLEADPEPLAESRSDLPSELHRIVRRCLKKNPDERYNDTRDLLAALKDLRQVTSGTTVVPERAAGLQGKRNVPRSILIAVALVAVAVVVAVVSWNAVTGDGPAPTRRVAPVHRQVTFTGQAGMPALSPDGRSIAYVEWRGEEDPRVMLQDVAGGQTLELVKAVMVVTVEWSPDGSQLYIEAELTHGERGGFLLPRLGGTPRSVWRQDWGHLSWSPDGERLAGGPIWQKKIWLLEIASGEEVSFPLDGEFTWLLSTRWSPDGQRLLLGTVDDRANQTLWTVGVDGEGLQKILEQSAAISTARWAPGGAAIYYLSEAAFAADVMKLPVDPETGAAAGEPQVVLSGLRSDAFSLSRDGQSMLYTQTNVHSNLVLMDIEPGTRKPVLTPLTSGTLTHEGPALSPDGGSVAFVRNGNIFTRNLDGGETRQLTFEQAKRWSPAWSPTGGEIAFGSNEGGSPQVWQVGAAGGAARPFEGARLSKNAVSLSWSPSSQVAYLKPGNRNVQLLDPESGAITSLLEDESVGWIFAPEFSPDGKKLAVSRNVIGDGQRLWIFDLETMAAKKLSVVDYEYPLSWSDDGAWIYLGDGQRVSRVSSDGGPMEPILEAPSTETGSYNTGLDLTADATRAIFMEVEELSDLWLIQNFDPDEAGR